MLLSLQGCVLLAFVQVVTWDCMQSAVCFGCYTRATPTQHSQTAQSQTRSPQPSASFAYTTPQSHAAHTPQESQSEVHPEQLPAAAHARTSITAALAPQTASPSPHTPLDNAHPCMVEGEAAVSGPVASAQHSTDCFCLLYGNILQQPHHDKSLSPHASSNYCSQSAQAKWCLGLPVQHVVLATRCLNTMKQPPPSPARKPLGQVRPRHSLLCQALHTVRAAVGVVRCIQLLDQ
jgi:hypothetical protein